MMKIRITMRLLAMTAVLGLAVQRGVLSGESVGLCAQCGAARVTPRPGVRRRMPA